MAAHCPGARFLSPSSHRVLDFFFGLGVLNCCAALQPPAGKSQQLHVPSPPGSPSPSGKQATGPASVVSIALGPTRAASPSPERGRRDAGGARRSGCTTASVNACRLHHLHPRPGPSKVFWCSRDASSPQYMYPTTPYAVSSSGPCPPRPSISHLRTCSLCPSIIDAPPKGWLLGCRHHYRPPTSIVPPLPPSHSAPPSPPRLTPPLSQQWTRTTSFSPTSASSADPRQKPTPKSPARMPRRPATPDGRPSRHQQPRPTASPPRPPTASSPCGT